MILPSPSFLDHSATQDQIGSATPMPVHVDVNVLADEDEQEEELDRMGSIPLVRKDTRIF